MLARRSGKARSGAQGRKGKVNGQDGGGKTLLIGRHTPLPKTFPRGTFDIRLSWAGTFDLTSKGLFFFATKGLEIFCAHNGSFDFFSFFFSRGGASTQTKLEVSKPINQMNREIING